ncbi:MAG: hypothetical protein QXU18_10465 [Thermoplasmatales archaeon]
MSVKNKSRLKEIEVGKGKIVLEEDALRYINGKLLMLDLSVENGPCKDNLCQVTKNLSLKLLNGIPAGITKLFPVEGCVIAMTDSVYRSIDRGRERITISTGVVGNLLAKGFSPTM